SNNALGTFQSNGEHPLWVISGHFGISVQCALYPRKRTFGDAKHMSAKGQKRASLSIQSPRRRGAMSLGQRGFFQLGHANMTAGTSAKCHKRTFGRAALTQPPRRLGLQRTLVVLSV